MTSHSDIDIIQNREPPMMACGHAANARRYYGAERNEWVHACAICSCDIIAKESIEELEAEIELLRNLGKAMYDHLEYCGWGDSWEQECSENLRSRAEKVFGRGWD